jgi:hypothetical protein
MLGAAASMTVQIMVWTRAANRAADEERQAWQEAANCLELLTAEGYDAVTPQRAAGCRLSQGLAAALGAGQLTVTVVDLEEPNRPKRITAEVTWDGAGPRRRSVRLATIMYAAPAGGKMKEGASP